MVREVSDSVSGRVIIGSLPAFPSAEGAAFLRVFVSNAPAIGPLTKGQVSTRPSDGAKAAKTDSEKVSLTEQLAAPMPESSTIALVSLSEMASADDPSEGAEHCADPSATAAKPALSTGSVPVTPKSMDPRPCPPADPPSREQLSEMQTRSGLTMSPGHGTTSVLHQISEHGEIDHDVDQTPGNCGVSLAPGVAIPLAVPQALQSLAMADQSFLPAQSHPAISVDSKDLTSRTVISVARQLGDRIADATLVLGQVSRRPDLPQPESPTLVPLQENVYAVQGTGPAKPASALTSGIDLVAHSPDRRLPASSRPELPAAATPSIFRPGPAGQKLDSDQSPAVSTTSSNHGIVELSVSMHQIEIESARRFARSAIPAFGNRAHDPQLNGASPLAPTQDDRGIVRTGPTPDVVMHSDNPPETAPRSATTLPLQVQGSRQIAMTAQAPESVLTGQTKEYHSAANDARTVHDSRTSLSVVRESARAPDSVFHDPAAKGRAGIVPVDRNAAETGLDASITGIQRRLGRSSLSDGASDSERSVKSANQSDALPRSGPQLDRSDNGQSRYDRPRSEVVGNPASVKTLQSALEMHGAVPPPVIRPVPHIGFGGPLTSGLRYGSDGARRQLPAMPAIPPNPPRIGKTAAFLIPQIAIAGQLADLATQTIRPGLQGEINKTTAQATTGSALGRGFHADAVAGAIDPGRAVADSGPDPSVARLRTAIRPDRVDPEDWPRIRQTAGTGAAPATTSQSGLEPQLKSARGPESINDSKANTHLAVSTTTASAAASLVDAERSTLPWDAIQAPVVESVRANLLPDARMDQVPPRSTPRQIADAGSRLLETGQATAIFLDPVDLGRVVLTLTTTETAVSFAIHADKPETADFLRRNLGELAQEFRDLGYTEVTFSFSGGQPGKSGQGAPHAPNPVDFPTQSETEEISPPRPGPIARSGLDLRL